MDKKQPTQTGFMPSNYEVPTNDSKYLKFKTGDTRFRILASPVIGWEDWKDKKPVRFKMDAKPEKPIDPSKSIKHFWAMPVLDCSDDKIKILSITQSSIQKAINALINDPEWGTPLEYDIAVTKKGTTKDDTEYNTKPYSHKPIDILTKNTFEATPINLEALFTGADPFAN